MMQKVISGGLSETAMDNELAVLNARKQKLNLVAKARDILRRAERSGKLTDYEEAHVKNLLTQIHWCNVTLSSGGRTRITGGGHPLTYHFPSRRW